MELYRRGRSYLNNEFQQLLDEADRIAKQTHFNGVHLLDGRSHDESSIGI